MNKAKIRGHPNFLTLTLMVAPLMTIPEGRRLSSETDKSDSVNTRRDWCPTGNSVCRLLHIDDIGSRWVDIVAARLRKLKKRSGVRDRARKKKAGDADRIWLTSRMEAIKKASTESTNVSGSKSSSEI